MSNYDKITKQDAENINDEDFFEGISNKNRELFQNVLLETLDLEISDFIEKTNDMEIPPPSKRHKIRMNRMFRERVGGTFLPFPEDDNLYEKIRSKLVIKLKINEFIDRCEKNRRIK